MYRPKGRKGVGNETKEIDGKKDRMKAEREGKGNERKVTEG